MKLIDVILKAVGVAMGVAVAVLATMHKLDAETGLMMLGLGLTCLGISTLGKKPE